MNVPKGGISQDEQLYRNIVIQTLTGFQLLEAVLKMYIAEHFDLVRTLLNERLHFAFVGEDYETAALGKLTQIFGKLCADTKLVADVHSMIKHRDHLAHRALLELYGAKAVPHGHAALSAELQPLMVSLAPLIEQVRSKVDKLIATGSAAGDEKPSK